MPRTAQQYADELLADNLAVGKTVVEAARAAGVSEQTAYRRLKEPAVRARIDEVRRAALDAVAGRLTNGMMTACDHLPRLIGHDNPHVQIRAAKTVLQLALQVRRAVDAEERGDQREVPSRLPPVNSPVADISPRPVDLEPGEAPISRPDALPEQPGLDGKIDSPTEGEKRSGVHAPAIGGGSVINSRGESGGGEPTPTAVRSPAPDSSGRTTRAWSRDPGTGTHRSDWSAPRGAVALGLLLAAGLSFAAGPARTHSERETVSHVLTCQNLPEPASRLTSTPAPEGLGERPMEVAPERAWVRAVGAASYRPKGVQRPAARRKFCAAARACLRLHARHALASGGRSASEFRNRGRFGA